MTRALRAALILPPLLVLGACAKPGEAGGPSDIGAVPSPQPSGHNLVEDGYTGRFRVTATVLESPDHGPQLCGAVADSLPPQCGGPDIVGWDWKAVQAESVNGTTWGDYTVVGTWDAATRRFTLTEPAVTPPKPTAPAEPLPDMGTPCPTPAGGWRPVDPAKATDDAQQQVIQLARSEPDFGGLWLDQSYLKPGDDMSAANDPRRYVLNVSFTKDLARHQADLRRVWGGALCVSKAARSMADLERLRGEVEPTLDRMVSSSIDEVTGTYTATVWVASAAQQREYDARYGEGAVTLDGWFEPID
jgi:hypothetical protein